MPASASKKSEDSPKCGDSTLVPQFLRILCHSRWLRNWGLSVLSPVFLMAQQTSGCLACHGQTDSPSMHTTGTVHLSCTDCHGGKADVQPPAGAQKGSGPYEQAKKQAHPQPRLRDLWKTSANPVRPYTRWLEESKEYIQFVNPGDLRVAEQTCGSAGCHAREVVAVRTSMMTHGAMLWEAALYNNGAYPYKDARFGESYSPNGLPQRLKTYPPPSQDLTRHQRRAAEPGAAAALGSFAARQHSARVRARRRGALRDRQSQSAKKTRARRTSS